MSIDEAIAILVRKTDPCEAHCLRCAATLRCVLVALAGLESMSCKLAVTEEDIEAEIARIRALYPELEALEPAGALA
jgi:hypothetical protein